MGSIGISCAKVLTRTVNTLVDVKGGSYPRDFALLPTFFTSHEQQTLLATALQKLDSTESRHARRRRKQVSESFGRTYGQLTSLQNLFYPDEYYEFEEVHLGPGFQVTSTNDLALMWYLHRAITMESFTTSVRCMLHRGQRPPRQDLRRYSSAYMLYVLPKTFKPICFTWHRTGKFFPT
jgi:hypothetical protein